MAGPVNGAAGGGTSPEELTSCQLRGENLAEVAYVADYRTASVLHLVTQPTNGS